jgi:two-component system NtrC family sensor kinase
VKRLFPRLKISFSAKVLLPVITVMVLLLASTVYIVNQRITKQFEAEATRSLAHADDVLKRLQKQRVNNLLLRYAGIPNEPRYKAIFQRAEVDIPTVRDLLAGMREEQSVDVVFFTNDKAEAIAHANTGLISISDFEAGADYAVRRALLGEKTTDTIQVGHRLYDVVAIPVFGVSDLLIGTLTMGIEIGEAAAVEMWELTRCQILLTANGQVTASTLHRRDLNSQFAQLFGQINSSQRTPVKVVIGSEHYFCVADHFKSLNGDKQLGYLLLSSYEEPLRALQSAQQTLLTVSAAGISLGIFVVWFLITKVTQPLRVLRAGVEAVSSGDLTRRVDVTSRDECGELAKVFNRMTENLQRSREELVTAVDTLKNTQAQLIQSEKLSGIGEFVAGVAHELNNPLTSVMGFSELLERMDQDPQHQRYLGLIRKSAQRCQKIVQSLLSFARRHQPERKHSSINELIEGAVDFLHYQLKTSNIQIETEFDAELPKTMLDPHQVQQVFLNIINNARQAIEAHQPTGKIKITTQKCGLNARVTFQDNGPGIPEANLAKVFDPFFTTKELGKGTGLGLSLCYGIIQEHGGTITVRSKPGQGAAFVIDLPLWKGAEGYTEGNKSPELVNAMVPQSGLTPGEGKKILVIDDEEAILTMVRDTLSGQGYSVETAVNGEDGLTFLSKNSYDLALCDWKMPGITGQQVYERLLTTNPSACDRMIFMTGDIINEKARVFLEKTRRVCLPKPFSLADFQSAIQTALSAA